MRDGVLHYKRRWSPRIVYRTLDGFAFSFPSCSRATQSFLLNNPFIFEQAGTLYGALFVPSKAQSSEELQAFEKLYLYAGMSKLVRYLVPGLGTAPTFEPADEGRSQETLTSRDNLGRGSGHDVRDAFSATEQTRSLCGSDGLYPAE